MKLKYLYIVAALVLLGSESFAQKPGKDTLVTYSDSYLDTVKVERKFVINDYSLIGVEYGAAANYTLFSPRQLQTYFITPKTMGVYYTRYGKMFGYMPYFGFKTGIRYTTEGYKFKENKETGVIGNLEGATQAVMDFVEVPLMAHFHIDLLHFKIMANVGIYGGYRLNIHRTGSLVDESIVDSFLETDNRIDYGLTGGLGFGLVFDPVEFHVNVDARYAWGSLYQPDYYSQYYYRFAYPINVMVTAGAYFQISRRTGRSKGQLRKEARELIYNPKTSVGE